MGSVMMNKQDSLFESISREYDLKIIEDEPIKKIIKLTTDQGIFALKKVRATYDRFLYICQAMEYARGNGFVNIPEILQTKDGKMGVKTEGGVYMLNSWIDGREADYHQSLDLELTTTALARFHKGALGFEPSKITSPRELYGKWIKNFQIRLREMKKFYHRAMGKEEKSEFDTKMIHYTDYFYDWGVKSIHHLEETDYYKLSKENKNLKTFCHHDMANHNVLLTKDQEVYFIDFDYCIMDMPIHDLASLIIRNIRYGNWSLDTAYFILNTYNHEKPILVQELGIIKAFMEFPQEFWQIGLQYYVEKQPWEEEVFHRRLDRILDDIPKREVFMKRFLV